MKISNILRSIPGVVALVASASHADSELKPPLYIHVNVGDLAGHPDGSLGAEKMAKQRLMTEIKAHPEAKLFQLEWSAQALSMYSLTKYWYDRRTHRLTTIERWGMMNVPESNNRKTHRHVDDQFVFRGKF